jgi:hypothetical protein
MRWDVVAGGRRSGRPPDRASCSRRAGLQQQMHHRSAVSHSQPMGPRQARLYRQYRNSNAHTCMKDARSSRESVKTTSNYEQ